MATTALQPELEVALAAVRAASSLTRHAQGRLLAGDTLAKSDDSPVTVADFAAQAIVCATLTESLGALDLVGEEDSDDLRSPEDTALCQGVVDLVRRERNDAVEASTVLDWIAVGSADGSTKRYWTLDPIDGTKGFLRGEQYAIGLALIEGGDVILGVLGCPNLPNPDGSTRRRSPSGSASPPSPTGSTASARTQQSLAVTPRSPFACRREPTTARRSGTMLRASSWSSRPAAWSPTSPAPHSTSPTATNSKPTAGSSPPTVGASSSCDNVITILLGDSDGQPVGHLDEVTRARLDDALRYSLDIAY